MRKLYRFLTSYCKEGEILARKCKRNEEYLSSYLFIHTILPQKNPRKTWLLLSYPIKGDTLPFLQ
jgi:hypothetical protein